MRTGKKQVLKLGVTGGIGSGKTSVCRVFNVLGIPVFSADSSAMEIMNSDDSIIMRINSIAGKDMYVNGILDRVRLASLIFNDSKLLEKVNSLVHPIVFDHFKKWEREQSSPYIILEAAILFESGASKLVDLILTVVAPVEERVQRIIRRNNLTREQVRERMNNQIDDVARINKSDYVINNAENDMIIPAVLGIHEDILNRINVSS